MNNRPNIDELAARVHVLNRKWWPEDINDRNKGEISMLIVSELTEAMEGERKDLMDDKLPHRKMAEVECADTAIRVFDVMGAFDYKFDENPPVGIKLDTDNRAELLYGIVGILACGGLLQLSSEQVFSAVIISLERYCNKFGYDLYGALEEKLEYNKHREDHKEEVRAQAGGKKW